MLVSTIGHGVRAATELVACLDEAGVETVVDVRRFPASRRNPQFNRTTLEETLEQAAIGYHHAVELGGRRSAEPGEELFGCIATPAFRSYAARMRLPAWQQALDDALTLPAPCFMCAETAWQRCHRRFIAELLVARGQTVVHLIRPREREPHRPFDEAAVRGGRLYLCGELVA